jgi:hypothetical protein
MTADLQTSPSFIYGKKLNFYVTTVFYRLFVTPVSKYFATTGVEGKFINE